MKIIDFSRHIVYNYPNDKKGDCMIYAYLRQLHGKRNIIEQQNTILSFSLGANLHIDKEVFEYSNKNHSVEEREQFKKFIHGLQKGDAIIVDGVWMLSEKMDEVIKIIHCILGREIILYIASSQMAINAQSSLGEILPLLNASQEEERREQTDIGIGRPKGSRSSSKFDIYQADIISMLKEGMNVSAIARKLDMSRSSLKDYIESRNIRGMVEGVWLESPLHEGFKSAEKDLLICPFRHNQIQ